MPPIRESIRPVWSTLVRMPEPPLRWPRSTIRICRVAWIGAAAVVLCLPGRIATAQVAVSPSPVRADTVARATITGVVRDSLGATVAGALVTADSGPRRATTDSLGRFWLDSIVAGRSRIQVQGYGYAPLGFEFDIGAGVSVEVVLTLLPAATSTAPSVVVEQLDSLSIPGDRSVIEGRVVDSAGRPLAGVSLRGMSTDIEAVTGPDGTFRIPRVAAGLHVLRARKLGMLPEYVPLRVPTSWRVRLSISLRPLSAAPQLAGVTIREDSRMTGFYERKRRGGGIFITREELEQKYVFEVSDVLRGKNAVEVRRSGAGGDQIIVGRRVSAVGSVLGGRCPLGILIDGITVPWTDISLDRLVSVKNVRAFEVYSSGLAVPMGFRRDETDCGAILIWTR